MRASVRCAAVIAALLASFTLDSSQAIAAALVTRCTPEQEAAYEPFDYDLDAVGCDELTFETCTDDCLKMYQVAAEHAPDCGSSSLSRTTMTYRELADSAVKFCERVRANTTNKYFPQAVPGVPKCSYDVYNKFDWNISHAFLPARCFTSVSTECSDECLQVIENQIVNAPVCSYGGSYTLGEKTKHYLVSCLNTRNEDLKGNKVLTTVVTPGAKQASSSSTLLSVGATSIATVMVVIMALG